MAQNPRPSTAICTPCGDPSTCSLGRQATGRGLQQQQEGTEVRAAPDTAARGEGRPRQRGRRGRSLVTLGSGGWTTQLPARACHVLPCGFWPRMRKRPSGRSSCSPGPLLAGSAGARIGYGGPSEGRGPLRPPGCGGCVQRCLRQLCHSLTQFWGLHGPQVRALPQSRVSGS